METGWNKNSTTSQVQQDIDHFKEQYLHSLGVNMSRRSSLAGSAFLSTASSSTFLRSDSLSSAGTRRDSLSSLSSQEDNALSLSPGMREEGHTDTFSRSEASPCSSVRLSKQISVNISVNTQSAGTTQTGQSLPAEGCDLEQLKEEYIKSLGLLHRPRKSKGMPCLKDRVNEFEILMGKSVSTVPKEPSSPGCRNLDTQHVFQRSMYTSCHHQHPENSQTTSKPSFTKCHEPQTTVLNNRANDKYSERSERNKELTLFHSSKEASNSLPASEQQNIPIFVDTFPETLQTTGISSPDLHITTIPQQQLSLVSPASEITGEYPYCMAAVPNKRPKVERALSLESRREIFQQQSFCDFTDKVADLSVERPVIQKTYTEKEKAFILESFRKSGGREQRTLSLSSYMNPQVGSVCDSLTSEPPQTSRLPCEFSHSVSNIVNRYEKINHRRLKGKVGPELQESKIMTVKTIEKRGPLVEGVPGALEEQRVQVLVTAEDAPLYQHCDNTPFLQSTDARSQQTHLAQVETLDRVSLVETDVSIERGDYDDIWSDNSKAVQGDDRRIGIRHNTEKRAETCQPGSRNSDTVAKHLRVEQDVSPKLYNFVRDPTCSVCGNNKTSSQICDSGLKYGQLSVNLVDKSCQEHTVSVNNSAYEDIKAMASSLTLTDLQVLSESPGMFYMWSNKLDEDTRSASNTESNRSQGVYSHEEVNTLNSITLINEKLSEYEPEIGYQCSLGNGISQENVISCRRPLVSAEMVASSLRRDQENNQRNPVISSRTKNCVYPEAKLRDDSLMNNVNILTEGKISNRPGEVHSRQSGDLSARAFNEGDKVSDAYIAQLEESNGAFNINSESKQDERVAKTEEPSCDVISVQSNHRSFQEMLSGVSLLDRTADIENVSNAETFDPTVDKHQIVGIRSDASRSTDIDFPVCDPSRLKDNCNVACFSTATHDHSDTNIKVCHSVQCAPTVCLNSVNNDQVNDNRHKGASRQSWDICSENTVDISSAENVEPSLREVHRNVAMISNSKNLQENCGLDPALTNLENEVARSAYNFQEASSLKICSLKSEKVPKSGSLVSFTEDAEIVTGNELANLVENGLHLRRQSGTTEVKVSNACSNVVLSSSQDHDHNLHGDRDHENVGNELICGDISEEVLTSSNKSHVHTLTDGAFRKHESVSQSCNILAAPHLCDQQICLVAPPAESSHVPQVGPSSLMALRNECKHPPDVLTNVGVDNPDCKNDFGAVDRRVSQSQYTSDSNNNSCVSFSSISKSDTAELVNFHNAEAESYLSVTDDLQDNQAGSGKSQNGKPTLQKCLNKSNVPSSETNLTQVNGITIEANLNENCGIIINTNRTKYSSITIEDYLREISVISIETSQFNDSISTEANPVEDRTNTEANPVEDRTNTKANPVEDSTNTEANPVEDSTNTEANSVEDRTNIEANPVENSTNTEANLVEDSTNTGANLVEDSTNTGANLVEDSTNTKANPVEDSTNSEGDLVEDSTNSEADLVKDSTNTEANLVEDSTNSEAYLVEDSTNTEANLVKDSTNTEDNLVEDSTNSEAYLVEDIISIETNQTKNYINAASILAKYNVHMEIDGAENNVNSETESVRSVPDLGGQCDRGSSSDVSESVDSFYSGVSEMAESFHSVDDKDVFEDSSKDSCRFLVNYFTSSGEISALLRQDVDNDDQHLEPKLIQVNDGDLLSGEIITNSHSCDFSIYEGVLNDNNKSAVLCQNDLYDVKEMGSNSSCFVQPNSAVLKPYVAGTTTAFEHLLTGQQDSDCSKDFLNEDHRQTSSAHRISTVFSDLSSSEDIEQCDFSLIIDEVEASAKYEENIKFCGQRNMEILCELTSDDTNDVGYDRDVAIWEEGEGEDDSCVGFRHGMIGNHQKEKDNVDGEVRKDMREDHQAKESQDPEIYGRMTNTQESGNTCSCSSHSEASYCSNVNSLLRDNIFFISETDPSVYQSYLSMDTSTLAEQSPNSEIWITCDIHRDETEVKPLDYCDRYYSVSSADHSDEDNFKSVTDYILTDKGTESQLVSSRNYDSNTESCDEGAESMDSDSLEEDVHTRNIRDCMLLVDSEHPTAAANSLSLSNSSYLPSASTVFPHSLQSQDESPPMCTTSFVPRDETGLTGSFTLASTDHLSAVAPHPMTLSQSRNTSGLHDQKSKIKEKRWKEAEDAAVAAKANSGIRSPRKINAPVHLDLASTDMAEAEHEEMLESPSTVLHRIPSTGAFQPNQTNGSRLDPYRLLERSQSDASLLKRDLETLATDDDILLTAAESSSGQNISECNRVYLDLSRAEAFERVELGETAGVMMRTSSGRLLETIPQDEELKTGDLSYLYASHRSFSQESSSSMEDLSFSPKNKNKDSAKYKSCGKIGQDNSITSSKSNLRSSFQIYSHSLKQKVRQLQMGSVPEQLNALTELNVLMEQAWSMPIYGKDLAYELCDILRTESALDIIVSNLASNNRELMKVSARLLEQSLTTSNRRQVAENGLELVVKMTHDARGDCELAQICTGILESLFKTSEDTCARVIKMGGLDTITYWCRCNDRVTLKNCAIALSNLALYGGGENQQEMAKHKVPEWLFPLAFVEDDSVRYYALLAIGVLVSNKEIENAVTSSGTLALVLPFIESHDPAEFAERDTSHRHGRSPGWLKRLIPVLSSKREEAQALAAFHFVMEAGIKSEQGRKEVLYKIGAVDPLKWLASTPNRVASKLAAQALRIIGEEIPHKLSQQVPLWTCDDVVHWIAQVGFGTYADKFKSCHVDGDLLLRITEEELKESLNMICAITRKRFLRELRDLKISSDYTSCDPSMLGAWLQEVGEDMSQYTYQMLNQGVDRPLLRSLNDSLLVNDCKIVNGIHRMKILSKIDELRSSVSSPSCARLDSMDGMTHSSLRTPIDVFISYRRSNGSQLASLLKVHLQLRGFTVFIDIEKLKAGKFDESLLESVRQAKNFIIVLTQNSLDRCIGDDDKKDWVHREITAALDAGSNIIPLLDNFKWPPPESLPEDMRSICYFNAVRWIHDYQDACVDKLEKFLRGETNPQQRHPTSTTIGNNSTGTATPSPKQTSCFESPNSPPYQRAQGLRKMSSVESPVDSS